MNYRFILEPYKTPASRYNCPKCGKKRTFSRYIDTETSEHISPEVGRCDRESNCGYHYKPKQYFEDNKILFFSFQPKYSNKFKREVFRPRITSFVPSEIFRNSLKEYNKNNFVLFLSKTFGETIVTQIVERYQVGTSKFWEGATVFWQQDTSGRIRTGKIMLYNPITGKRSKEQDHKPNWVHSVLKLSGFSLQQCFFGEHLLGGNMNPVAIVESEKTAIIASIYLPQFIWIASGSLTNLNIEKCNVLKGRNIVLFPDLNCLNKWSMKADELTLLLPGTKFSVSNLLERKATDSEKKQGLDIADYLLKFPFFSAQ